MTAQNPQSRRGFFQRQNKEQNSAKAYMRNFGKGRLELADNSLMFYLEKGTITKHKELVLQVSLAGLESAALEANELSVTVQGETKRFVIEDVTLAKTLYEKANEFSTQTQTPETQTQHETFQLPSEENLQPESAVIAAEQQATPETKSSEPETSVTGDETQPTSTVETEKLSEEKTPERDNQQPLPATETPSSPPVEPKPLPAPIEPAIHPLESVVSTNPQIPTDSKAAEIEPQSAAETSTPTETVAAPQPFKIQQTSQSSVDQLLLASTTEFPFPAGTPTEQAIQATQTEPKSKLDVNDAFPMVDALFDIFFSMQGSVDWQQVSANAKHYGKAVRKIRDKKLKSALDFSMLIQAVQEHRIKLISKEGYRLLKFIYAGFQDETPEFAGSKKVIESYFVLNDVFLAKVVEDANTESELSEFNTFAASIFGETESKGSEVIEAVSKAVLVHEKDAFDKARSTFKQSLAAATTSIPPVL
jgi:hypothetical protein